MDDLEFVQRCVKGDRSSWDEFLKRYSRLIYNYIYSVLKTKGTRQFNPDDINDLFQEIFVSLTKDDFKKLRSFKARNGCSLASWLRQVTINFTIDYLRKTKPVVSIDEEIGEDFSLKDILVDATISVKDRLSREEKFQNLKECIEGLESRDKYFLELYISRELKLEELREVLRLSRGAVDMQKARIIERLKECFKNKGAALDF